MARGDIIARGMVARITRSTITIDVTYPALRPIVPGTTPITTAPTSPLTGIPIATTTAMAPATPNQPPLTLPCLWYDATRDLQLTTSARTVDQMGWVDGAHALLVVRITDAALDPGQPNGDTVFTAAEFVVKDGSKYTVLKVTPVGAGFREPVVYAVWVRGAEKQ